MDASEHEAMVGKVRAMKPLDKAIATALMQTATEDNCAMAFAMVHEDAYVYVHGRGAWYRWDDTRWKHDSTGTVHEVIRDTARILNPGGKAAYAKHSYLSGVEKILRTDPRFARHTSEFDADNYLLNTPARTYDLLTGKVGRHKPGDCLTQITSVSPTQDGGERYRQFLDEIMDGDRETIAFLKRALGSMLSGAVEEHWMLFFIGHLGRNGKNVLGDLLLHIFGDYGAAIPSSTLMSKRHGGDHPTELMNLKGKRLVVSSEVEEGSHWNEARIKELTGDAAITARWMRQDFQTFNRTHKHLVYGNHRPQLRSADQAMRSRMKPVPFRVSFAGREDPDLPAKLRAEAGYVLHWLMEGHRDWLDRGKKIGSCTEVDAAVADYFGSQGSVECWIDECCVDVDNFDLPAYRWEKSSNLYRSYRDWKEERGESPVSQTRWGEAMQASFPRRKADGFRYGGIGLRSARCE